MFIASKTLLTVLYCCHEVASLCDPPGMLAIQGILCDIY